MPSPKHILTKNGHSRSFKVICFSLNEESLRATGRNAMHCMRRYNAALQDLLSAKSDAFIWKSAMRDISSEQKESVSMLYECIMNT